MEDFIHFARSKILSILWELCVANQEFHHFLSDDIAFEILLQCYNMDNSRVSNIFVCHSCDWIEPRGVRS